jgi:hypothetical protein
MVVIIGFSLPWIETGRSLKYKDLALVFMRNLVGVFVRARPLIDEYSNIEG